MRRTLLIFALSALGFALLFITLPDGWFLPAGIWIFVIAAALGLAYRKFRTALFRVTWVCAAGALFALTLTTVWNETVWKPTMEYDGVTATVTLTVSETPYVGDGFVSFDALVTKIAGEPQWMTIRVTADEGFTASLGEELTVFGRFYASDDSRRIYDRAKGIRMRLELRTELDRTMPDRLPVYLLPTYVSERIGAVYDALLPKQEAALVSALVLGDRDDMPVSVETSLRRTGLSHVAAVSGFHITLLTGLLMTVFRRKLGMVLAVPAILFFALMTGAPPSVMRSVIMQLVWIFSFPLKRESDALTSMGFAAVCILCANPYAAGDVGLWLSFASTAGMTLWADKLTKFFTDCMPKTERKCIKRIVRYIASALASTLSAQVLVLPISLLYFGELSVISPVANLALLLVVQAAFFLGILCAMLAFVAPAAAETVALVTGEIARWFLDGVDLMAKLPFSYAASDFHILLAVGCGYLLLMLTVLCLRIGLDRRKTLTYFALCLTIVVSLTTVCRTVIRQTTGYLLVPNMRGGQCVLLTAKDVCVAVNCGGYGGMDTVSELLTMREIRDIDLLLVTDYNETETNELLTLFEEIPVKALVLPTPRNDAETEKAEKIGLAAVSKGVSVRILPYGEEITAEEYAIGDILVTAMAAGDSDTDRGRMTVSLTAGKTEVLVTGAVKPETLEKEIDLYAIDDADYLVLSGYYGKTVLPDALRTGYRTLITTGYDGVLPEVQRSLTTAGEVIYPTYEKVILEFGL